MVSGCRHGRSEVTAASLRPDWHLPPQKTRCARVICYLLVVTGRKTAADQSCISAAPAALNRYPCGFTGHVAHPIRSIRQGYDLASTAAPTTTLDVSTECTEFSD